MYLAKYHHLYNLPRVRVPERDWGRHTLRLHRNEKPDSWSRDLLDRMFDTVPDDLLQRYPDPEPLYKKLSEFLGVPRDRLLLTSGIDEAIRAIISLACDSGDIFGVPWPGYAMYDVYARMFRCNMVPIVYSPDHFMSAVELCDKLPTGAKVLFLPNPSQPVENCFSLAQLGEIAGYCQDRDILFAVDEAYHFFGAPTALPLIDTFPNLLVMRSFSKAFGAASLRLGYVVGGSEALTPLSAFRLAHEVSGLTIHAASVLVDCFESHVKPSIDSICEGRDYLRQKTAAHGLRSWGCVSNNVLIDLASKEQMEAVTATLEGLGIYVKGRFPHPLDHHVMVTCGPRPMMEQFFNALLQAMDSG